MARFGIPDFVGLNKAALGQAGNFGHSGAYCEHGRSSWWHLRGEETGRLAQCLHRGCLGAPCRQDNAVPCVSRPRQGTPRLYQWHGGAFRALRGSLRLPEGKFVFRHT